MAKLVQYQSTAEQREDLLIDDENIGAWAQIIKTMPAGTYLVPRAVARSHGGRTQHLFRYVADLVERFGIEIGREDNRQYGFKMEPLLDKETGRKVIGWGLKIFKRRDERRVAVGEKVDLSYQDRAPLTGRLDETFPNGTRVGRNGGTIRVRRAQFAVDNAVYDASDFPGVRVREGYLELIGVRE